VAAGSVLAGAGLVVGAVPAHADGETVSIGDVTMLEGPSGKNVTAKFTVTLSAPRATATKVTYTTSDGSATAGSDYTAKSGTVSIGIGKTSATVSVVVSGDAAPESSETLLVNLTGVLTPTVTIDDNLGVGTIVDDDATNPASVSIGDTTVYEGDSGMQSAVFSVRLTAPVATDTLIPYTTSDGGAVAPTDYKAKSGTAKIKAGKTSAKVSITTYGNTGAEGSRQFFVILGSTSVPVLDGTGTATIIDDEGAEPGASISDATVVEGDTGTVVATHVVTLTSPAPTDIGITYVMTGTGASAGLDFKAKTGTLKIKAGKTSGKISVTVNGDTLDEADEGVEVSLTGTGDSGIAIIDGTGTTTIIDDDGTEEPPVFTWSSTAADYPGGTGATHSFTCPAGGEAGSIWGTTIYTDDSSICTAAVHMGIITFEAGGEVTIEILGGQTSYVGSTQNGVTSNSWGSWPRSFQFFVEIPI
jgi:hypothetical protein